MRPSSLYLTTTLVLMLILALGLLHSWRTEKSSLPSLARKAALVRQLELTDLCLFTEASYTRHMAMTDRATPFQDAPMAMEHFPTGALVMPPASLLRNNDQNH